MGRLRRERRGDGSHQGGREPGRQRAPSAAMPRARPRVWRRWVLRVWVAEPWAASLASCSLNGIQPVCCALCVHPALRRAHQRATHCSGTEPAPRAARQQDPKVSLTAPGHRSPFEGVSPQRFSPQRCQARSRYSTFLSSPPSCTVCSAQAECPPFASVVGLANPG